MIGLFMAMVLLWLCFGLSGTLIPMALACPVWKWMKVAETVRVFSCRQTMIMVLLLGMFRIGEAANPGPSVQFAGDVFTLGTFNPSGLRNKANYVQSQLSFGDIWTIAETHFYGKDVSRFRAGLQAVKSDFKYCLADQTSLHKSLTSQNSWKGVAVLSRHPTRAIPSSVPPCVQNSGRALLFTTLLGDTWVSGAAMYGEPNSHHYPAFQRNNEVLLHHVASHVCNLCVGPRFIAGDLNVVQNSLPAFGLLQQAGFREIQDIALERWGFPVQATCKGKTRPDFLYVSPELADLLLEVEVLHDVWPDHSVLYGRFRCLTVAPSLWVWPTPSQFPWPQNFATTAVWPTDADNMTHAYADLWKQIECDAAAALPYPIQKQMFGRGSRTAPCKTKGSSCAPVKVGRKGDFQPEFCGTSLRHAQWIRQTRRIQAFARLATNTDPRLGPQKAEAWGAILRAKGFFPTYAEWWITCGFKTSLAPGVCPVIPPEASLAQAMFDSMVMAVRNLEADLRRTSRQYARFRRDQNPNLVFADIRPQAVPGVDILLQPIRAVVENVQPDEGLIVLDRPCDFLPDKVISCDGKPLNVIHHEHDALWVEDVQQVPIGGEICQTKTVGSHVELEQEFVQAWRSRWMRHATVPPERWNDIVNFAKRFLPRMPMVWDALTPADIRQVVARKKRTTAHGFDGVTLADLQSMPEPVLLAFCQTLQQSEKTGQWPSQLVDGKVVSLAKVSSPGSPSDFRPITIFSLLYRVWSSHHSRKALASIDQILPDTLYGSRPGRYAAQVWAKLLWSVEHAFQETIDLTGLVADLQKAFNLIPRLVVFEIAGHLGLSGGVLLAWAGALQQMKRRFVLRGSLTVGVPSVTGFPEGCGLSCVAMLLIDFAFHRWHQQFFPLCTALSYVDDWQLICPHSTMLERAKFCLEKFVQAVDLKMDPKKSYAWSVTGEGRHRLRQQGFSVVLAAKNLGAHVQVSRKHTNASLMDRVQSVVDVWPKLRLSACRYATKVRSLLVAAWPKALHAITATTISDAAMHSLRTGAMKGLNADNAGSNCWLQLGMIEHPLTDPQFWAIVQTIRCARDCGDPQQICHAIGLLISDPEVLPVNCITSTLLSRLHILSWRIDECGVVHDDFGSFSLFEASLAEVTFRAQWAWQKVVAQQVAHRPGFVNLHQADAPDTRSFLRGLPADEVEVFHRCLNGSHITQDKCIAKRVERRFVHFVNVATRDSIVFGSVSDLRVSDSTSLVILDS